MTGSQERCLDINFDLNTHLSRGTVYEGSTINFSIIRELLTDSFMFHHILYLSLYVYYF